MRDGVLVSAQTARVGVSEAADQGSDGDEPQHEGAGANEVPDDVHTDYVDLVDLDTNSKLCIFSRVMLQVEGSSVFLFLDVQLEDDLLQ